MHVLCLEQSRDSNPSIIARDCCAHWHFLCCEGSKVGCCCLWFIWCCSSLESCSGVEEPVLLFECQQLRWKETAVPTELCSVLTRDYDGLSTMSAHLWMLRAAFIQSGCSESQSVTKNTNNENILRLIYTDKTKCRS